MTHPFEEQRKQQEQFLANMPEEERGGMRLMFSVGNASFRYHQEVNNLQPTETHYKDWLSGLPPNIRKDMEARGFEGCKTVLPFTRFVMESNDLGMDEWMRAHLTEEEYGYWEGSLRKPG